MTLISGRWDWEPWDNEVPWSEREIGLRREGFMIYNKT